MVTNVGPLTENYSTMILRVDQFDHLSGKTLLLLLKWDDLWPFSGLYYFRLIIFGFLADFNIICLCETAMGLSGTAEPKCVSHLLTYKLYTHTTSENIRLFKHPPLGLMLKYSCIG